MELRHLRYFVAVAEELHFSRAAERLNVATPTVSVQIRALEALLGAQLFTRKTRGVALTDVGSRFLTEARATLKQADLAELIGRCAARGESGSISVGYVFSAACTGAVSQSIREFRDSHPEVSFQLRKMETLPQMKALVDGALDVGFMRAPERFPTGLAGFAVNRQSLLLAMPDGHALSSHDEITPEMVADEPFVATSVEMEICFWSNIAAVTLPGKALRVTVRVPDAFSVMVSVAAGIGLGVVSESLARMAVPGIVFRRIVNTTRDSEHVVVFRKNETAKATRAYIAALRSKATAG